MGACREDVYRRADEGAADEVVPIFPRTRGEAWSLQALSEDLGFLASLSDGERAEFLSELRSATIEFGWVLD